MTKASGALALPQLGYNRIEPTGRILELGSLEVADITNVTWFAGHLLAFRVRCLDPSPESIDCPGRSVAELTRVAPDGRVVSTTRVGFWKLDGGEASVSLIGGAGPKTLWVRTDRLVEIDPEGRIVSQVASEHAEACAIGGRLWDLVALTSGDAPDPLSFEVLEWRDRRWRRVDGSEVRLLSASDHIVCRDGRYELERVNQRPLMTWTPAQGWRDVEVSAPRALHGLNWRSRAESGGSAWSAPTAGVTCGDDTLDSAPWSADWNHVRPPQWAGTEARPKPLGCLVTGAMSVLALVPIFPIIAIFDAESNVTRVTAIFFVGCVYFRMHDAFWGDAEAPADGERQPDRRGLTYMTVVAAVAFVAAAALAH